MDSEKIDTILMNVGGFPHEEQLELIARLHKEKRDHLKRRVEEAKEFLSMASDQYEQFLKFEQMISNPTPKEPSPKSCVGLDGKQLKGYF